MEYLRARGRVLDGPAARPGRAAGAGPAARRQGVRGVRRGLRDPVGLHDHGVRPPAAQPGARPHRRLAGGADRLGRGPHVRPRAAHRRGQDLRPRRPALRPGRRRPPAATTPRARRARCSRKASPRRAPWPPSSPWPRRTPRGASPWCPVYLFYSMFGFQRVGDLAWSLGDMRGRGILAGCTAGRTTLHGRGPAARRRAVAAARLDQPRRHGLRRLVRLRGGHDHGRGGRRDAGPRAPRTASGT